ncbi:MAG: hypothetical protein IKC58_04895 [Clostridia bacterium]|nr:hypothetical protein [Clostridia bacterium]MBR2985915.1 hypothetical protein [Clostridia bacterium]
MKPKKRKIREALVEALLEIVLTAICLALGALVLHLFGVDFSTWGTDPDTLILTGVFAFLFVLALVFIIVQWAKSIAKSKSNNNKSSKTK